MPDVAQLSIEINSSQAVDAQQNLDRLTQSGQGCENALNILEKAALHVAEAFAAWEVISKIQESVMSAARYETLGVAMDQIGRNAGYSAQQMALFQSQLQATGISMIESRNNLTRMASAQLDLGKSAELARVAQDAAVVAGINSSEAFERLVQGIVSGQPKILHTMGIFADFKGAEDVLAKAHNETKKQLTNSEAAQARMNAVLEEGAKRAGAYEAAMGTAGKQLTSMQRYIDNLEVQFGETFGPALTTAVGAVTDGLKNASKALSDWEASGEMGMTQAHLKNDMQDLISTISTGTHFIYAHRDAIMILGASFAGLKIASVLQSMGQWVTAQKNAVLANAIAAQSDVDLATKKVLTSQAAVMEAYTLGAEGNAKRVLAEATNELSAAEARLATEESASAIASGVATTALASVGGAFGIVTMAITGAAAAWAIFHDKTKENSRDAVTSADAEIASIEKKIKAIQGYYSHSTSAANVETALHGPDDNPAIKALDKQFGEWQIKEAQLKSQIEKYSPGLAIQGDIGVESTEDIDSINGRLKEVQNNMDLILQKRQKLVEDLNNFDILQDRFQNDQSKKSASKAVASSNGYHFTEYGREVNRLEEELTKLTISEREAYEMKLRLMDNGAAGDVKEAMRLYNDIDAAKHQKAVELASRQYDQQEGANLQSSLQAIQDAYEKVTIPEKELLRIHLLDQGASKEVVEGILKMVDATKKLTAQKEAEKKITDEVNRLNQKDDYTTRAAHLQDLLDHGLNPESYRKEMHKVLLESNTLWGDAAYVIENYTDRGSEALANFFNGTKTGFRDMVASMLVDLEKLYIKQQLVSPLFNWFSDKLGDWGLGDTTTTTANANIPSDIFASVGGAISGSGGASMGGVGASLGTVAPISSGSGAGVTNQTSIVTHIHQDGTATSKVTAPQGQQLGAYLDSIVQEGIRKQMQPGGLLNRKN